MEENYEPFPREATLQELMVAWQLPYHILYKLTRLLKIRAKRGDRNRMLLTVEQQHAIAEAVASTRVVRPMFIERLTGDEQRAEFARLHSELDRLAQSHERLSDAYEVSTGLAQTYREHLNWLTPVAEERLGRIEAVLALSASPDFATTLRALKTLNAPTETPLRDVQGAAVFCALVAGILARRLEHNQAEYDRLITMLVDQPLGLLCGQLTGHLFGLGATLEAALTVHRERQGEASAEVLLLEQTLTQVLSQLKRWTNDSMAWLGERVRPLAADAVQAEASAPLTATNT